MTNTPTARGATTVATVVGALGSAGTSLLLADVWGLTFDLGTNVVDVYIRRLRGKLDRPERIETVRHVGYAFAVN